jgi:hypothetical protein
MVCLRYHHFTRKLQIILFCHERAKLESSVWCSWLGECVTKDVVMYYRVFSHCLEPDRNLYAYNYCLPGSSISNRNNDNKYILQCFPHKFKWVNIKDLSFRITMVIRCHSVGLMLDGKSARMIEHIMLLENRLKDEAKTYTNFWNSLMLAHTNVNGLHFTGELGSEWCILVWLNNFHSSGKRTVSK